MTVGELITQLSKFPPDDEVFTYGLNGSVVDVQVNRTAMFNPPVLVVLIEEESD